MTAPIINVLPHTWRYDNMCCSIYIMKLKKPVKKEMTIKLTLQLLGWLFFIKLGIKPMSYSTMKQLHVISVNWIFCCMHRRLGACSPQKFNFINGLNIWLLLPALYQEHLTDHSGCFGSSKEGLGGGGTCIPSRRIAATLKHALRVFVMKMWVFYNRVVHCSF